MSYEAYPGGELVSAGLEDLRRGEVTVNALLVSIGASRLRHAGVAVPAVIANANERLYELLEREYGDGAHSRYNSLIRRLVSFERALESLGAGRA
jgi:hypothetical protein